ncbi:MAG: hypothetical protein RBS17_03415 [Coriobacteriia bacterium]|nr:hypothetical protein [Coriobacteriia bacterium]
MTDVSEERRSRLLVALDDGLPVTLRPFADLGARIGMTGDDVIVVIRELRDDRTLRRVGAVLSPAALGYQTSLCAVALTEEDMGDVASVLADVPNVTHAFEMNDRYRLWFVLSVPSAARLEIAESELAARLGAVDRFRVLGSEEYRVTHAFDADGVPESPQRVARTGEPLDVGRRALVRLLQGDLPLMERPFSSLASTLADCGYDADEQQVFDDVRALVQSGVVQQFRATLHVRTEPWRLALTVWINPRDPEGAGDIIAAFPEVVHCFDRRIPGGGKAIVAIVETHDRTSLDRTIGRIRSASDLDAPRIAYPLRELKRASMRYFSEGD